ncbi:MAG: 2Fe-2S iron-sulfur cluster-binding protein [Leptospirales bacterium]
MHRITFLASSGGTDADPVEAKTIRVEPVREGWMLLDALLKRGVKYPHLCKLGDCRRCKSVLISGGIESAGHYEGALSDSEIARGVFLACRATPTSDCSIRLHRARTDS